MTVEDLSHLAADSLWPTSQHAGNRPSANSAMTAPGTASPAVDTGDITGEPFVVPEDHQRTTIVSGGGS